MSKLNQELRVLLFLNELRDREDYVTVGEVAKKVETSDRQARRYLEDLCNITELDIDIKRGCNGGYKLRGGLDKNLFAPENIMLALSVAMKRNEHIESVLSTLPNYVIVDRVTGDNTISSKLLDNLEDILKAIKNQNKIFFRYNIGEKEILYYCEPYKIYITNKAHYLFCVRDNELKKLNISYMKGIKEKESFKPKKEILDSIESLAKNFGIKNGEETTFRVKCVDKRALLDFDRYFEEKGIMDEEELTYTVIGNSMNELFYPLFRISTKKYKFLDEDFKKQYVEYLKNQIKSIERMEI